MRYRLVLVLGLALITGLGAQTTGSGMSTSNSSALLEAMVKTSLSPEPTAEISSATTEVTKADLSSVSVIEGMYQRFVDQKQYGYDSFSGEVPSVADRGRVPDDYVLGPGDRLSVLVWGDPVDLGDLTPEYIALVGTEGLLFYPPVGQVRVDQLRKSEAEKLLSAGLAKKYRRFELRLQVTPRRVFPLTVAGLVGQPGVVMIDAWTTVDEVLAKVGGVKKNGTLRALQIAKANGAIQFVDLYELLISGKKPTTRFDEGDVLRVGPIGRTAAVYGEVKVSGIFELREGETIADLLSFAGGALASAQGAPMTRVSWNGSVWERETSYWTKEALNGTLAQDGDLYQYHGPVDTLTSKQKPGFVQVGGQVAKPGFVPWRAGLSINQALEQAGGALETATLGGLNLIRQSAAVTQKKQVEASLISNRERIAILNTQLGATSDPVVLAALTAELATRTEVAFLLSRTLTDGSLGRVFLEKTNWDDVLLLPGDQLVVPEQSGVVFVFGEVYNPGAQVWTRSMTVKQSILTVGGVTTKGDWDEVYVVRISGRVDSVRARGNWLGLSSLWGEKLQPGDFIYVPVKNSSSAQAWTLTKDVVAVLSQTSTATLSVLAVLSTLGVLN